MNSRNPTSPHRRMPELLQLQQWFERLANFIGFRLRLLRMAFRPLRRLPTLVVMALDAPDYEISSVAPQPEQAESLPRDSDAPIYD